MSPDGQTVVTGAGDETLRFWNCFSRKKMKQDDALNPQDQVICSNEAYTVRFVTSREGSHFQTLLSYNTTLRDAISQSKAQTL
jgi:WD40 repeat protein